MIRSLLKAFGGVGSSSAGAAAIDARNRLAEKHGPLTGWLDRLLPCYQAGNVFFAHAGADPMAPLAEQSERALYWGLPFFFDPPRADGAWVVHGHYIVDEAQAAGLPWIPAPITRSGCPRPGSRRGR